MIDPNQREFVSRAKGLIVIVVFVGLLLAQVAIPLQRLLSNDDEGPTRFGWQMFTMVRDRPVYVVHHLGGGIDTVNIADHLIRQRPEVDLPSELPPHLCRHLEEVSAVTVRWPSASQRTRPREIEYRCAR